MGETGEADCRETRAGGIREVARDLGGEWEGRLAAKQR
jgi:hypothetical protein